MSEMAEAILTIERLTLALPAGADRASAVEDVSLALYRRQILCVVGESGSGKSVCAAAVMGLLPKAIRRVAGAIHFEGRDLLNLPAAEWRTLRGRRIAMIFQEPMTALNPVIRIGDQIMEAFEAHDQFTPTERRAPPARPPRRGRHARSGADHPQLPASVVGWPASACHDRNGTRARTVDPGRGRTNHGTRRHHAGADPSLDPRYSAAARHGGAVHHS